MRHWSTYRQGPPSDCWLVPNPTGSRVITLPVCSTCQRITREVFGQTQCGCTRPQTYSDQLDQMLERVGITP